MEKKGIDKLLSLFPRGLYWEINTILGSRNGGKEGLDEVRLIANGKSSLVYQRENLYLSYKISDVEMEKILSDICSGATYAYRDSIKQGFLPFEGGIRVGVSGTARYDGGALVGISHPRSMVFRLPLSRCDFEERLFRLFGNEVKEGTLIYSPPGVGKTTLAIFFLTWLAGKEPDKPMLTGSHSNSFLRGVYDECLRIMSSDGEYLWHDVFQDIDIERTNAADLAIDIGTPKRFATLQFTSVGSGNAGKVRAEGLLYCDDLVSGIEQAMSKERLDKLWEQYTTDLRQRKIGNCVELHIATRWSVHDVIGRIEQKYIDSKRAKFIVMSALDDKEQSNFDYANGVGFSTNFYHDMRDTMDDASWRALYMNQPIEREGLLYAENELRRYFELPEKEPDGILSICDTKDRGKDYAFMPVAYMYGNDYYIADCICDNSLPEVVEPRIVNCLLQNKVQMSRFEHNNAGGRVAKDIQNEIRKMGGITKITTKFTTSNKETKIIVHSAFVKEHFLFKDKSLYKKKDDYGKMMDMLCSYTVAGKNKHDDVPDGMAMLSEYIQSLSGNKVEIFERFF
jgi:predicted phage terminase large subunit-like protein